MEYSMTDLDRTLQAQCAEYVSATSKWLKFMGIIMIISLAFMALAGIVMMAAGTWIYSLSSMNNSLYAIPGVHTVMGVMYIILAGIYVFPTVYILRAAKAGKTAVISQDNEQMVVYAKNMKSYWKFCGIVCIIALAAAVLCIIGGIVAGVAIAATM